MFTKGKVTEIFFMADEFGKVFNRTKGFVVNLSTINDKNTRFLSSISDKMTIFVPNLPRMNVCQ